MSSVSHPVDVPQAVVLNMEEAIGRMGDREIYLEIARYFASHLPMTMRDLATALGNGNFADAARLAHSLKGNCATVGADSLRDGCQALERLCREEKLAEAQERYALIAPQLFILRNMLLAL